MCKGAYDAARMLYYTANGNAHNHAEGSRAVRSLSNATFSKTSGPTTGRPAAQHTAVSAYMSAWRAQQPQQRVVRLPNTALNT